MGAFLKHKRLRFTFVTEPTFQVLLCGNFTTKDDLNPQKQVFLLKLKLSLAQKQKFWSIYIRKICSAQDEGFWFKN